MNLQQKSVNYPMTESEYRKLDIDSYSSIKVFLDDRKKYYKKFVLKEVVKDEEESNSLRMGSLVDCLLFTPDLFDQKYLMAVSQIPTGQYAKLIDKLMKITLLSQDENGFVTRDIDSMFEDAYNAVKFDRDGKIVDFKRDTLETAKEKFYGTELELYYQQLRESHDKTIIDVSFLENAYAIVNELKTNSITSEISNLTKSDGRYEVYHQFPIIGEISGDLIGGSPYPVKVLLDKMVIDHEKKEIDIFDQKVTWDNENEFLRTYLKFRYYIQGALYFYMVVEWSKKHKGLQDYWINYPSFIVADSSNYKMPLIYQMNRQTWREGMEGFTLRGNKYTGLLKAITDIRWHKENGIWNISRDNYENGGKICLKPFSNND
jgi:hypothetical protein